MENLLDSGLVWLRRDLRTTDHAALSNALQLCKKVFVAFVFDTEILKELDRHDQRVEFIWESLAQVNANLVQLSQNNGCSLIVKYGVASEVITSLAQQLEVNAVFCSHDDEPQSLRRDSLVEQILEQSKIRFFHYKDHVLLERSEVLTQSQKPYSVFTPYKNAWLKIIQEADLQEFPIKQLAHRLAATPLSAHSPLPSLEQLGFEKTALSELKIPLGENGAQLLLQDFESRINDYSATRNFPSIKGPSYLGVHLRFGTISIRQLARLAWPHYLQNKEGATVWLSELIWRDFYAQIMHHHPHIVERSFKLAYDKIEWEQGPKAQELFQAWCQAKTGYPLVDAAMEQLNQTGYMHNRLRMVVASFLVKHLGLDWRLGEAYFAKKLNDFDLASNNGGWQWASSSGCDAQPYFRIFNPVTQSEKFDKDGKFIKRYLPQLAKLDHKNIHAPWLMPKMLLDHAGVVLGQNYPYPIVDHAQARAKTLLRYAVVSTKNQLEQQKQFDLTQK